MDSLCKHTSRAIPKLQDFRLEDIVLHLLEKGLNLFGDKLSISELYRWFTLVEYDDYFHQLITAHSLGSTVGVNHRSSHAIRGWLNQRESIQYSLIEHGLVQEEEEIGYILLIRMIGLKFVGNDASDGFRLWCLEHAAQIFASNEKVALELASWSTLGLKSLGSPLSDQEILSAISEIPRLIQWND